MQYIYIYILYIIIRGNRDVGSVLGPKCHRLAFGVCYGYQWYIIVNAFVTVAGRRSETRRRTVVLSFAYTRNFSLRFFFCFFVFFLLLSITADIIRRSIKIAPNYWVCYSKFSIIFIRCDFIYKSQKSLVFFFFFFFLLVARNVIFSYYFY